MKKRNLMYIIAALCLALATPAMAERYYKTADSSGDVKKGDKLIVGRIRIEPPLEPGEQNLRSRRLTSRDNSTVIVPGAKKFMNSFFMLLDTKKSDPTQDDLIKNEILVPIDETFALAGKKAPVYVLSTGIAMTVTFAKDGKSRAFLPSGYKIPIGKNDDAVYIGTIVYYRDEFMRVSKVSIKDEYDSALRDMKKKFGKGFKMRKALVDAK